MVMRSPSGRRVDFGNKTVANHARKVTGGKAIRHAEAFQRMVPNVVGAL